MDGIIQIDVKGSYVEKDTSRGGVQGEAEVTTLRITFSPDWAAFKDKRITFFNALGRCAEPIPLTEPEEGTDNVYLLPIPGAALEYGGWYSFVIDGYSGKKRKRSEECKLMSSYAGSYAGE